MRLVPGGVLFTVLTLTTQIGGIILLISWIIMRRFGLWAVAGGFLALYVFATIIVVPPLAKATGHIPLPCGASGILRSVHPVYCLLNRHYVTPELYDIALALAEATEKAYPGTPTLTLDTNFPFLSGFPLLPHLSHDDGEKLDLALHYEGGERRSPIGYFAFETPRPGDRMPCDVSRRVTLRWNLHWLQGVWPSRPLDEVRQSFVLNWLAQEGSRRGIDKVFIEPYLADRLGATGDIIRFQGCRAARHDDHLHLQL